MLSPLEKGQTITAEWIAALVAEVNSLRAEIDGLRSGDPAPPATPPPAKVRLKFLYPGKVTDYDGDEGLYTVKEQAINDLGAAVDHGTPREVQLREANGNATIPVGSIVPVWEDEYAAEYRYLTIFPPTGGAGTAYTADEIWLHLAGVQFQHIGPKTGDTTTDLSGDYPNGAQEENEAVGWTAGPKSTEVLWSMVTEVRADEETGSPIGSGEDAVSTTSYTLWRTKRNGNTDRLGHEISLGYAADDELFTFTLPNSWSAFVTYITNIVTSGLPSPLTVAWWDYTGEEGGGMITAGPPITTLQFNSAATDIDASGEVDFTTSTDGAPTAIIRAQVWQMEVTATVGNTNNTIQEHVTALRFHCPEPEAGKSFVKPVITINDDNRNILAPKALYDKKAHISFDFSDKLIRRIAPGGGGSLGFTVHYSDGTSEAL